MAFRWKFWQRIKDEPPPAAPEQGVFISGNRDDLQRDLTAAMLSPAQLGVILREAEAGDIRRQCEAFEYFETDPHIYSVLGKRKRAAASKSLQLTPSADDAQGKAAVDLCEELIAGIENWDEALYDLYDAVGKGFAASQIVWVPSDDRVTVPRLAWWPQREFTVDEDDPETLRVLTADDNTDGEPLQLWQWIVHKYKARSATLATAGLLRVIAWFYVFKHFAVKDWVIFSEAYGMPRRIGKYPQGAGDEEKRVVAYAVKSLGKDGAAIIPEGAELAFLEAAQKGQSPFAELAKFCNAEISKAVLGQTLTTEAGDKGARSLGEVHERVEQDLMEGDCKGMARTLRSQLLRPMVGFNMSWDAPVPYAEFLIEEDEDLLQRAERDKILAVDMGLPMSVSHLRGKYDSPEPKDEKDTLVVPSGKGAATDARSISPELQRLIALTEEKKSSLTWAT